MVDISYRQVYATLHFEEDRRKSSKGRGSDRWSRTLTVPRRTCDAYNVFNISLGNFAGQNQIKVKNKLKKSIAFIQIWVDKTRQRNINKFPNRK